jgi:hypothetical protein
LCGMVEALRQPQSIDSGASSMVPKLRIPRKLEDRVEGDEEGNITSRRQREVSNARQLGCPW